VIRYALAVALVVAILGLATTAADHGATVRSETTLATTVERIDAAAVDLYENEALAPVGSPPPQRVLDVTVPEGGYTSVSPDHVTFARLSGRNLTHVSFRFPGRAERRHVIDAPLVRAGEEQFRLNHTGTVRLFLRLVSGTEGRPVVSVTPRQ